MKYLIWLSLVAVGVFALACGSAPTAAPAAPQSPQQAAPAPQAPAPQQAVQAPQAPRAPAAAAPAAPAAAVPAAVATIVPQEVAQVTKAAPGRSRGQTAHINLAASQIDPVAGYPNQAAYGPQWVNISLGLAECLFVREGDNLMAPQTAESFQLAPDLKQVTFKLKQGVPFNSPVGVAEDFGEMTAHDWVWFLNDANPTFNVESTFRIGGDLAAAFGEAKVVDDYTFTMDAAEGVVIGAFNLEDTISEYGKGPGVYSKKAFDTKGAEWMKQNLVSTGPFIVKEWVPQNRAELQALPEHHKHPSHIATFTRLHVPETASRIAMLQSKQADIVELDPVFADQVEAEGFRYMVPQPKWITASYMWSGNLWEQTHARTGEVLDPAPWDAPSNLVDYPWIGNPWCERGEACHYEDTDNPPGMSDMEQARLVRWALSYAIDRQGIVDGILNGYGAGMPTEYMGPNFGGWDPNRKITNAQSDAVMEKYGFGDNEMYPSYGVATPMANFPWPWDIPYQPSFAEEILDIAGYPRGSDGTRFEISTNIYRAEIGDVSFDIGDLTAGLWEAIGVKTTILNEDYGSVVATRFRLRTQIWPTLKNGAVDDATWPAHWPLPLVDSSLSRPGWGAGFESRFLADMHNMTKLEPDRASAIEQHMDVVDWTIYWHLYSGVVEVPKGYGVNPEKVSEWVGRSTQAHWAGAEPWFIVPAQ